MKIFIVVMVILVCLVPRLVLASAGASASIPVTITVTGDNGFGGDYHDWSSVNGGYYVPPVPKRPTSPTLPITQPNSLPVPPTMPTYTNPPQVTPVQGIPMPVEQQSVNFAVALIAIGGLLVLFMAWYLWSKRKPKKLKIESPILPSQNENKEIK